MKTTTLKSLTANSRRKVVTRLKKELAQLGLAIYEAGQYLSLAQACGPRTEIGHYEDEIEGFRAEQGRIISFLEEGGEI